MISRLAVGVLLAVAGCARADVPGGHASGNLEIGAAAPAYRAVSLAGDSVSLAAERGKVVLLNVWATWCHPCRTEIPELRVIHDRYKGRGLELIGVSVDASGSDESIRAFMKDFQMTYPIWRDPDERVSTQFLLIGVPATFLVDRRGVLRWRKTGAIRPNDTTLSAAIERALGEGAT